jgi:predicted phosphodiesterase
MQKIIRYLLLRPIKWIAGLISSNPDRDRIFNALTKLKHKIRTSAGKKGLVIPFDAKTNSFIIFSDQHKGIKNGADDFQLAESNYLAALDYYNSKGFHLISLGDSEELWENTLAEVKRFNKDSFEAEKKFLLRQRFTKVFGNHDLDWEINPLSVKELRAIYGAEIVALEGIILEGTLEGKVFSFFCTHGHQGDLQSDGNFFSKFFISKIWAPLQAYLHINPNTPAYNETLKTEHNRLMYEWASEQEGMLLITGHTHQPVFESLTHYERIQRQKDNALYKAVKPCYFNTGCCCFDDGDITGIEIDAGLIKLIKWKHRDGASNRIELESESIDRIVNRLR